MKFDDFFSTLNDWGRYQKKKYLLICLSYMLPSIMVYQYSFTAAQPSFRCVEPSLSSLDHYDEQFNRRYNEQFQPTEDQCRSQSKGISLKECQRCLRRSSLNSSDEQRLEHCSTFVFDRSIYHSTLTEQWTMVCDRVIYRSWIQMIFFVGYMIGSIFFGILADRYGRRPVMGGSFVLMSLSSLICALSPGEHWGFWPSYLIFVLGRFLLACSTRGVSISAFVLASEIVGPSQRLFTGIVIEYFFAFGQWILLIFALLLRRWRSLTWALTVFTVPYLSFYFFLPESPRWLFTRNRFDRVEELCKEIARTNHRTYDPLAFQQLKEEEEEQQQQQRLNQSRGKNSSGVRSLFQSRAMSGITLNLFFQWLVQNLVFYGVSQNTGSWSLNPYLSFGLSALVELLAYVFVHFILDRLGRKKPYYTFVYLFSFFSFLLLPVDFFFSQDQPIRSWLIFSLNLLLKFCASASYSIIYIYANELFPTSVRNTGMGLCSMVARIGAILGTFANDSLSRLWLHLPFIVYGSLSLLAALLSLMFPETLTHPLPQTVNDVEQMLRNKKGSSTNNNAPEKEEVTRF